MKSLKKINQTTELEDLAGKVAWGATIVAISAALVAAGALVLTDKKSRNNVKFNSQRVIFNLRRIYQALKQITS